MRRPLNSIQAATRVVVAALALLVVAAIHLAAPASALPVAGPHRAVIDPSRVAAIEIHKFMQPLTSGAPASGLPQDTTGLTPVAGAGFTARLVPGIDLTTSAGWAAAAALTPEVAATLVAGQPVAGAATTNALGNATLGGLSIGVYYVEETTTPAGFTGSAPFLVTLPLTNPDTHDAWLWTVHVYPKNARVGISLDVDDAAAVALGDTVAWSARASIPSHTVLDGYRVAIDLDSRLALVGDATGIAVTLDCDDAGPCPVLVSGTHFVATVEADGSLRVDFTPAGLALLQGAVAAHPFAAVVVSYETVVLGMGDLLSHATLYPSQATIAGDVGAPPPVSDTAATRWGPLGIIVHELHHPDRLIPGADFQLYLTADDAAHGTNPVAVAGVDRWTSDQDGQVTINGLRFSAFVNGLQRDPTDPLFREYYVSLVGVPHGYQAEAQVLSVQVNSTTEAQVVVVEVRRTDDTGMPITGAQIAGMVALTAVLLLAGFLLLAARRLRSRQGRS